MAGKRVRARYIGILGSFSFAVVPKKRQRNVQKRVLHEQSSFFLLIKPTDFFWLFSLPSPFSITRFYILFE